jgi:hypothetical protein
MTRSVKPWTGRTIHRSSANTCRCHSETATERSFNELQTVSHLVFLSHTAKKTIGASQTVLTDLPIVANVSSQWVEPTSKRRAMGEERSICDQAVTPGALVPSCLAAVSRHVILE